MKFRTTFLETLNEFAASTEFRNLDYCLLLFVMTLNSEYCRLYIHLMQLPTNSNPRGIPAPIVVCRREMCEEWLSLISMHLFNSQRRGDFKMGATLLALQACVTCFCLGSLLPRAELHIQSVIGLAANSERHFVPPVVWVYKPLQLSYVSWKLGACPLILS